MYWVRAEPTLGSEITEVSSLIRIAQPGAHIVPKLNGSQGSFSHVQKRALASKRDDDVQLGRDKSGKNHLSLMKSLKAKSLQNGVEQTEKTRDLRSALNALPRDAKGTINPELLVEEEKKSSLGQAIERLVLEGLGTGADIAFEHAVQSLFARYADDLGLDEKEFEQAKNLMLKEVRDVVSDNEIRPWDPSQPAPASMDLESTVEMLQEKVFNRRRMMLEASGDLSRVLAELTVSAQSGDTEELTKLGGFLQKFGQAVRARSSHALRETAKKQLLSANFLETERPADHEWGEAFLDKLSNVG